MVLEGILICHVDDIIYGGTNKFEREIISKLIQTFTFGREDAEASTYIGIELTQHADFTITMSLKNYISKISFSKEQTYQSSDQKDEKEGLSKSC